jgi:hypothetical protein
MDIRLEALKAPPALRDRASRLRTLLALACPLCASMMTAAIAPGVDVIAKLRTVSDWVIVSLLLCYDACCIDGRTVPARA